MDSKKIAIGFLIGISVLYAGSVSFGVFFRFESNLEQTMPAVKQLVNEARREIKKELSKPWWKRLIGSLFGMEKNKFNKIMAKLPGLIEDAMPKITYGYYSTTPFLPELDLRDMSLIAALQSLSFQKIEINDIYWDYDPQKRDGCNSDPKPGMVDNCAAPEGFVLKYIKTESGRVNLVIQSHVVKCPQYEKDNPFRLPLRRFVKSHQLRTYFSDGRWRGYKIKKTNISNAIWKASN